MQKHKLLIALGIILLTGLVKPSFVFAQDTAIDPAFNPNKLIEDNVFADTQTFGGPAGVQKFLEVQGSILANTSPEFLQKLQEPNITILKQALDDPHPTSDYLRSAAEIIWDAAQASGLNPQVILVTLNKEQSLITGLQNASPDKIQRSLDYAMGFGCPDSGGCQDIFKGFYFQLFGNLDPQGNRYLGATKSLMKSYSTPGGRGPAVNGTAAKVGDTITLDNTQGSPYNCPAQQTITLSNQATAALYRYTPHVCNGNYNFWKFFNTWFRYPNGTILKVSGDVNIYIIQNGSKLKLLPFVATARGLNMASAVTASPTEITTYPDGGLLGLVDNTIISVNGKFYVFLSDQKRPASEFVIKQRGLTPSSAVVVSDVDAANFPDGPALTPSDGSIIRGQKNLAVYLVENGTLKLFSGFTFSQHQAAKFMKIIPDSEIDSYPKLGFVAPFSGTLIKSGNAAAVFLMESGLKRPLSSELFKNRGFSFKNVVVLSSEEIDSYPPGNLATPKEGTYFKTPEGNLYFFKDGAKHAISAFVAKQRSITPDFAFNSVDASSWTDGSPMVPKNNTLIKGNKDGTVYVVIKGQLRALTAGAFKNRKYNFKNIKVLPQLEVDSYPQGDIIVK